MHPPRTQWINSKTRGKYIHINIESELNPKVEDAGAKEVTAAEASAKDGEGSAAEEAGAAPDAMTAALYGDLGLFKQS